MTLLLTGNHPERGTLWAAIDPTVHHVEGAVRETRFGARLAPFKNIEEAEAALIAVGAAIGAPRG
jgi:hypothetical protein